MSDITVHGGAIPQQPLSVSPARGSLEGHYSLPTAIMIATTVLIGAIWDHVKNEIAQNFTEREMDISSGRLAACNKEDFPNPSLINRIEEFALKILVLVGVAIVSISTLMAVKSGLDVNPSIPTAAKSSNPIVKEMESIKEKLISNIDNFSSKIGGKDKATISAEVATYLEAGSIETLKEGCTNTTTAREAFIDFLCKLEPKEGVTFSSVIDKPPIEIKELLGPKGLKLYNAAKKEELNSAAFREAVFVKSASKAGAATAKAVIAPIIGPSSAGKSTVRTLLVEQLFPGEGSANKIVDIDGSNERELSQVSNLLLKYANRQGYQSINGLHEQKCGGAKTVKSHIEKATKGQKDISLVIPLTFAGQGFAKSKTVAAGVSGSLGFGDIKKLTDLAQKTGRGITLAEVVAEDPKSDSFQKAVVVMGRKRAEAPIGAKTDSIDSEVKGSESKKYNPQFFINGREGSKGAKIAYQDIVEREKIADAKIFTVYNNLGAYKKEGEDWVEVADVADASLHSNDAVLINSKQMAIWEGKASLPDTLSSQARDDLTNLKTSGDLGGFAKACNKYGVASGFEIRETSSIVKSTSVTI